jgi:hypothetical protein
MIYFKLLKSLLNINVITAEETDVVALNASLPEDIKVFAVKRGK